MSSFDALGLRPELLSALRTLGFHTPTPVQERAIPLLLNSDHDVVVLATLLFGFTARMLALRWKLGLPVFHYTHDAH